MPEQEAQTQKFDKVLASLTGLPDVKFTRPSTILDVMPMVGDSVTWVVQTAKVKESNGFVAFVQIVDAEGRARFVVPPKVLATLYRQRESLSDRSTPASRAKAAAKRARDKAKKEKAARSAAWKAKNPDRLPGQKKNGVTANA